jgi:polar amino acid transport system substrate-binding protein
MNRCSFILRATSAAAAVICCAFWLSGCGDNGNRDGETTLERIERTGTVRIAYANEAPFGYKDLESGRVTGEAPEIARVILQRLGATDVQTTLVDWGQLIPGLKAGRYDIVAAGMYITPQRAEQVDFSNPTYAIGEGLLVAEGNPHDIHSYADIRDHDSAILGVVGGTVEVGIAKAVGIDEDRVRIVPDNATAVQAIKAGRIHVFGGTALTVQDLAGKHDGVEPADPMTQPQIEGYTRNYGGFAFRQTDDALREAFNAELATFVGSEEHLELVEPFGFDESYMPGDMTAERLIARVAADAE